MDSIEALKSAEIAAWVQTHLLAKEIQVVLSGGGSVSYYTDNDYISFDIDLINLYFTKTSNLVEAMQEIGFQQTGRHFRHPKSVYFVEFPPGPLAVGSEPVQEVHEREISTGILRIISPTDCVKDRLIAYYHWNDQQCLGQALMVAKVETVDLKEIERWSKVEGMLQKFQEIEPQFIEAQNSLP